MTALPDTKKLILDLNNGWLTVWFNSPENRNALSEELAGELKATLDAIRDDRSVRGVTLRGKGGTFCAGGDLKAFMAGLMGGACHDDVAAMNKGGGDLFQMVNTAPQVVIALVEGAAIGGGMGLVCCADVVIAVRDAKFSLTETQLGIPPAQIAPHVVRRVGLTTARRLMLTGARFDGAEAKTIGLADYIAEDALQLETIETDIRKSVSRCAPGANAVTKDLVLAAPHLAHEEMMERAANNFAKCLLSDEGREGVSAFVEKRKPAWALQEKS
ncbi:MAG: enoyl-CoA hydratase-related protein [Pseudomonadota bacterium]